MSTELLAQTSWNSLLRSSAGSDTGLGGNRGELKKLGIKPQSATIVSEFGNQARTSVDTSRARFAPHSADLRRNGKYAAQATMGLT